MAQHQTCPQDVLQWIPWYPDEGLSDGQRARVEAHAADCPRCRDEIGVVLGSHEGTGEVPDAERALAGLWSRIEAEQAAAATPELRAAPAPRLAPATRPPRAARGPRLPALAAAAALVLVAGAGMLGALVLSQQGQSVFRTASQSVAPATAPAGPSLEVVFADDARASRIREALRTLDAEIVAGPTAMGRFRVRLPEGADARAAAEYLRSEESDVALFAEPSTP